MRHSLTRTLILATCLAASALGGGCATVQPWQRGRLASPTMQFQFDPEAASQTQTILEITEGATFADSGSGSAGGGAEGSAVGSSSAATRKAMPRQAPPRSRPSTRPGFSGVPR